MALALLGWSLSWHKWQGQIDKRYCSESRERRPPRLICPLPPSGFIQSGATVMSGPTHIQDGTLPLKLNISENSHKHISMVIPNSVKLALKSNHIVPSFKTSSTL